MADAIGPTRDQAKDWLAQSDVAKGALSRLAELTTALSMPDVKLSQDIVATIAVLNHLLNELGTLLSVRDQK